MKLRTKVIIILAVITIFFLAVDYTIQRTIIFPTYIALEESAIIENLQRVKEAITREIQHLDTYCRDWAFWDDTYDYVETHAEEYEVSNLIPETFSSAKLNMILVVDATGIPVWQGTYDFRQNLELNMTSILADPATRKFLLGFPAEESQLPEHKSTGILLTSHGPMLIASRPILTSNVQGPARGAMIMGRFLDDETISVIREQTKSTSPWN